MATDPRPAFLFADDPNATTLRHQDLVNEATATLAGMTPAEQAEHLVRLGSLLQSQSVRCLRYAQAAQAWRRAAYQWRRSTWMAGAFAAAGLLVSLARSLGWYA